MHLWRTSRKQKVMCRYGLPEITVVAARSTDSIISSRHIMLIQSRCWCIAHHTVGGRFGALHHFLPRTACVAEHKLSQTHAEQ